jgi:predicted Fe-S protein YdhL (DUF1289 family)
MRAMTARYAGTCKGCGSRFPVGERISWSKATGAYHRACWPKKEQQQEQAELALKPMWWKVGASILLIGALTLVLVAGVAAFSTSASGSCDPNYAGACLGPNSSDYDCEGGAGDGPDYTGTVEVVGDDPYDLDRDGDGSACDV